VADMMEAGVVIVGGKPAFWHLPEGRSSGSLPDSRSLWDVLWENRGRLDGFAHSHPGGGWPGPSMEDLTTFRAVEKALGRMLNWWIVSQDHMVVLRWSPAGHAEQLKYVMEPEYREPDWVWKLREHSYVPEPGAAR